MNGHLREGAGFLNQIGIQERQQLKEENLRCAAVS